MDPISSIDDTPQHAAALTPDLQQQLLQVARDSIGYGLRHHHAMAIDPAAWHERLRQQGASFVTLNRKGSLRGCIGALQAFQPLVTDVAEHAWAAAFTDPRFPPLGVDEFADILISVSVLGSPMVISFSDEQDLLRQLRPAVDGLILEEGANRGTFLPSVWESLPEPGQFLQQLKRKAGLPTNYWSAQIKISRYTTQSFSESV
ncbi:MAG: AmmeMemoRadiSam system protein A [Pseudomonadota bacterium]